MKWLDGVTFLCGDENSGGPRATAWESHLPDAAEIDALIAEAQTDLLDSQRVAAALPPDERPTMRSWLDRFDAA